MKKRMIALFLTFAMLVPFTPAVAAEDTAPRPTVEEILSEYHQKAFEAEAAEQTGGAAAYSRGAGSSEKTLEEETVDTLVAAGYEAYNVTSENYEALEAQLQTDFSDMGLDSDSSYIIVISGEEDSAANHARIPNPNVGNVQAPDGGPTQFEYTYGGTTYTMRYVTVTSVDDSSYRKSSSHDLLATYSDSVLDRLLEAGTTAYLDALNKYIPFGTLASILGLQNYLNRYRTSESSLSYFACTTWTRSYIQVWNNFYEDWTNASCAEYVKMEAKISGYLYNHTLGEYVDVDEKQINKTEYSTYYYNYAQLKLNAVVGYNLHSVECDVVGSVSYLYGNTTIAYHHQNF